MALYGMRVLGAVPLGCTVPGLEPAPSSVEGWHTLTVFVWQSVNFRESGPIKCWIFFSHFYQEIIPKTGNEISRSCLINASRCSDLGNQTSFL